MAQLSRRKTTIKEQELVAILKGLARARFDYNNRQKENREIICKLLNQGAKPKLILIYIEKICGVSYIEQLGRLRKQKILKTVSVNNIPSWVSDIKNNKQIFINLTTCRPYLTSMEISRITKIPLRTVKKRLELLKERDEVVIPMPLRFENYLLDRFTFFHGRRKHVFRPKDKLIKLLQAGPRLKTLKDKHLYYHITTKGMRRLGFKYNNPQQVPISKKFKNNLEFKGVEMLEPLRIEKSPSNSKKFMENIEPELRSKDRGRPKK